MQRRHFLKLFGVAAAASVVSSQLPAVPMAPIPVTAIPVISEEEMPLECAMEEECVVVDDTVRRFDNPHNTTKADVHLGNAKETFERFYRDAMEVPFKLPRR